MDLCGAGAFDHAIRPTSNMKKYFQIHWLITAVSAVVFFAGLSAVSAQGEYEAVTGRHLVGAQFNHYYDAQKKAVSPPDFTWNFTTSKLTIQAASGPIPPHLRKHLAGGKAEVKKIEVECVSERDPRI